MKVEKKITRQDIDEAHVRLRNFLGMKPDAWLPGLLTLVAALAILALATIPGIRKNGTWYTLASTPSESAVFVDGAYRGATPGTFFVPRGMRTITVSRPGFTAENTQTEVGGKIFATLLFPRRTTLSVSMKPEDPRGILRAAFTDFSGFGLAGTPSAIYQIPLVLSDAVLSLCETGSIASLPRTDVTEFSEAAIAASGSAQSFRDTLRASFFAAAGGVPSPIGLIAGIETLGAAVSGKPQIASLLSAFAQEKEKQSLSLSGALKNLTLRVSSLSAPGSGLPNSSPGSVRIGLQTFIRIPASGIIASGESPTGTALPYYASVPAFALAQSETTRSQWASFLSANPEWKPENRNALISSGVADASYLADWNDTSLSASLPVTGVSYHAAEAYCTWLSRSAPAGFAIVLPTEAMWETASRAGAPDWKKAVLFAPGRSSPSPAGSAGLDRLGFADLAGNVWEWCDDSFVPYPAFMPASSEWKGTEFSVRGASWANTIDAVSPSSRGGCPASFSSPFLGFRPAMVVR